MKLVRAAGSVDAVACAGWRAKQPSSDRDGPRRPIVDRYSTTVRPRAGEAPAARFARVRARLLAYDIYPPRAFVFALCPPGRVQRGTTIVQRVRIGGLAIEAGVRVVDVWWRATDAGFTYVTLAGHPECGVETFRVRLDDGGDVHVLIEARSHPGELLTWLGLPIARLAQRSLTRAALRRLGL
jgi:Domain of unknown function (DUF1990)